MGHRDQPEVSPDDWMKAYTEILNEVRPDTQGCVHWASAQYFYNAGLSPKLAAEYHLEERKNIVGP